MGTNEKMALDTSFWEGRIRLLGGRRSGRRDIKLDEEMDEKDKEKRKEIMRIVYVLLFHAIKLR